VSQFDYVVVGAGTAGCLLANRLSADPARRVLLLEAGPADSYPWIHIPVGYLYCINNPRTDWCLSTEPEEGLNGRHLAYPRGKVLGGSSSINGMIYMRGQARDFDFWSRLTGDDEWSWDRVLPDFRAHEGHYRLDARHRAGLGSRAEQFAQFHGAGGEWRVEKQRLRWEILEAFAAAARQAGIPASDDFNCGDNTGVGYFEVNQRNGWRWSTARAFLRPVLARRNLTVWKRSHACRLVFGRDPDGAVRCTGVELVRDGGLTTVSASREVILCSGSVGTPQLLQLSGIGPAELLQRYEIPLIVDSAGVGRNLQDHLQVRSVYKVSGVPTLNTLHSRLWRRALMALEYAMLRTGPMSMAPSQLGAFTRSDASLPHSNIEYHVQPLSLDAFGQPLHTFSAFTASVCNLNPTSRGTVEIRSARFDDAPRIVPNYLSTESDRKVAADSLRLTRRIALQPALARYHPEELRPGMQFQEDADLIRCAGDIATTIFHPVGTARMGAASDTGAVLDTHLRVRGTRALRVVDASIMPTITSGNTNSPTLMIAEKAARWIRAGE
jgi:choline dehydrogenase